MWIQIVICSAVVGGTGFAILAMLRKGEPLRKIGREADEIRVLSDDVLKVAWYSAADRSSYDPSDHSSSDGAAGDDGN